MSLAHIHARVLVINSELTNLASWVYHLLLVCFYLIAWLDINVSSTSLLNRQVTIFMGHHRFFGLDKHAYGQFHGNGITIHNIF